MTLFTSILKDNGKEIIPKPSVVPKRFNKPWFTYTCIDVIKERNRAFERFEREPIEGNLNAYRIARVKACRNIRHSKKIYWRNRKHRLLLGGIGSVKKKKNPVTLFIICLSMIEMSPLIVTLLMH